MSYSFQVKTATKADTISQVAERMKNVVQGQPLHAADEPIVNAAAKSAVELLQDDSEKDVAVTVNGSVSCNDWSAPELSLKTITSVTVNLSAYQAARG